MEKRTVHYDPTRPGYIPVNAGGCAVVWPIDHTSELVSNTKSVVTSRVIKVNADGSFETENSIYVPKAEEREEEAS